MVCIRGNHFTITYYKNFFVTKIVHTTVPAPFVAVTWKTQSDVLNVSPSVIIVFNVLVSLTRRTPSILRRSVSSIRLFSPLVIVSDFFNFNA